MEKEDDRIWTAEEIEEHEHDEWLKLQERGEEAYKEVEDEFRRRNEEEEEEDVYEDPYEKEERRIWKEEEEKAKEEYFKMIREEEEKGIFRQTVAELIEEESLKRKSRKKMDMKEEDEEPRLLDSSTTKTSDSTTDIDDLFQKIDLNNPQAVVECQEIEMDESTKAKDEELRTSKPGQIIEGDLKKEEVRRKRGEEEEEEKKIPTTKANNLWEWLRNMWTAPRDIQSNDIDEKQVKHKAPDEKIMHKEGGNLACTNCQKDFTEKDNKGNHMGQIHEGETLYCTECTKSVTGRDQLKNHVMKTETNYSQGGSHMFHKAHVNINPYRSSDIEENEVKRKAPDKTIMPNKEEMFELDALTLEEQFKQAMRPSL